jgi:hypothetical protein
MNTRDTERSRLLEDTLEGLNFGTDIEQGYDFLPDNSFYYRCTSSFVTLMNSSEGNSSWSSVKFCSRTLCVLGCIIIMGNSLLYDLPFAMSNQFKEHFAMERESWIYTLNGFGSIYWIPLLVLDSQCIKLARRVGVHFWIAGLAVLSFLSSTLFYIALSKTNLWLALISRFVSGASTESFNITISFVFAKYVGNQASCFGLVASRFGSALSSVIGPALQPNSIVVQQLLNLIILICTTICFLILRNVKWNSSNIECRHLPRENISRLGWRFWILCIIMISLYAPLNSFEIVFMEVLPVEKLNYLWHFARSIPSFVSVIAIPLVLAANDVLKSRIACLCLASVFAAISHVLVTKSPISVYFALVGLGLSQSLASVIIWQIMIKIVERQNIQLKLLAQETIVISRVLALSRFILTLAFVLAPIGIGIIYIYFDWAIAQYGFAVLSAISCLFAVLIHIPQTMHAEILENAQINENFDEPVLGSQTSCNDDNAPSESSAFLSLSESLFTQGMRQEYRILGPSRLLSRAHGSITFSTESINGFIEEEDSISVE